MPGMVPLIVGVFKPASFVYSTGMREQAVESYLYKLVKICGGRCIKLVPVGWVGIPDRLVIVNRTITFVELKKPKGGVYSKAQLLWHDWLREQGQRVECLHTRGEVDDFVRETCNRMDH